MISHFGRVQNRMFETEEIDEAIEGLLCSTYLEPRARAILALTERLTRPLGFETEEEEISLYEIQDALCALSTELMKTFVQLGIDGDECLKDYDQHQDARLGSRCPECNSRDIWKRSDERLCRKCGCIWTVEPNDETPCMDRD